MASSSSSSLNVLLKTRANSSKLDKEKEKSETGETERTTVKKHTRRSSVVNKSSNSSILGKRKEISKNLDDADTDDLNEDDEKAEAKEDEETEILTLDFPQFNTILKKVGEMCEFPNPAATMIGKLSYLRNSMSSSKINKTNISDDCFRKNGANYEVFVNWKKAQENKIILVQLIDVKGKPKIIIQEKGNIILEINTKHAKYTPIESEKFGWTKEDIEDLQWYFHDAFKMKFPRSTKPSSWDEFLAKAKKYSTRNFTTRMYYNFMDSATKRGTKYTQLLQFNDSQLKLDFRPNAQFVNPPYSMRLHPDFLKKIKKENHTLYEDEPIDVVRNKLKQNPDHLISPEELSSILADTIPSRLYTTTHGSSYLFTLESYEKRYLKKLDGIHICELNIYLMTAEKKEEQLIKVWSTWDGSLTELFELKAFHPISGTDCLGFYQPALTTAFKPDEEFLCDNSYYASLRTPADKKEEKTDDEKNDAPVYTRLPLLLATGKGMYTAKLGEFGIFDAKNFKTSENGIINHDRQLFLKTLHKRRSFSLEILSTYLRDEERILLDNFIIKFDRPTTLGALATKVLEASKTARLAKKESDDLRIFQKIVLLQVSTDHNLDPIPSSDNPEIVEYRRDMHIIFWHSLFLHRDNRLGGANLSENISLSSSSSSSSLSSASLSSSSSS